MKYLIPLFALVLSATTMTAFAADPAQATTQPAAKTHTMDHGAMQHAATPAAPKPDAEFIALDKNKDGKLTKDEFPAKHPLAPHFGMLDSNRDGSLSPAEFDQRHGM